MRFTIRHDAGEHARWGIDVAAQMIGQEPLVNIEGNPESATFGRVVDAVLERDPRYLIVTIEADIRLPLGLTGLATGVPPISIDPDTPP